MLVLTRKPGESIQIGPDITLTVFAGRGNKVRLGIQAPAHVRVLRSELKNALSDVCGQESQSPCIRFRPASRTPHRRR